MAVSREEAIAELKRRGHDTSEFELPSETNNKSNDGFLNSAKGFGLGLGQSLEDILLGQTSGTAAPEVDIPEHWKPEKIRKENLPYEEPYKPSLNLEQYVEPENKTAFNVGRYGPALGAALYTGGKSLAGSAKALTSTSVGNQIVRDANSIEKAFRGKYGNFFGDVRNALIEKKALEPSSKGAMKYEMQHHADIPLVTKETPIHKGEEILGKGNFAKFKKEADSDLSDAIRDFIKNPEPETAHWAKSSAGALKRELKRIKADRGLSPDERKAFNASLKIEKNLNKYMQESLKELGPNYAKQYSNLGKQFKTYYAPYLGNRDIRRARLEPSNERFIEPRRLPERLEGVRGDPFMRQLGEKHPELKTNRLLASKPFRYITAGIFGDALIRSLLNKR